MNTRICKKCGKIDSLIGEIRADVCRSCSQRGLIKKATLKVQGCGYIGCRRTYLHREIMQAHIGRKLNRNEHVHHIDGNKLNNDISNLTIISAREHHREHLGITNRLKDGKLECMSCKELKPFNEYPTRKNRALGVRGTCKICMSIRKKERKNNVSTHF